MNESEIILSNKELKNLYTRLIEKKGNKTNDAQIKDLLWGLTQPVDQSLSIIDIAKLIDQTDNSGDWSNIPDVYLNISKNKLATSLLSGITFKAYATLDNFLSDKGTNLVELHLKALYAQYPDYFPSHAVGSVSNLLKILNTNNKTLTCNESQEMIIKITECMVFLDGKLGENFQEHKLSWIKQSLKINRDKSLDFFVKFVKTTDILPQKNKDIIEEIINELTLDEIKNKLTIKDIKKITLLNEDKTGLYIENIDTTVFNINIEKIAEKQSMPTNQVAYRLKLLDKNIKTLLSDVKSFVNIELIENKHTHIMYVSYEKDKEVVKELTQALIEHTLHVDVTIIAKDVLYIKSMTEFKEKFLAMYTLENQLEKNNIKETKKKKI